MTAPELGSTRTATSCTEPARVASIVDDDNLTAFPGHDPVAELPV